MEDGDMYISPNSRSQFLLVRSANLVFGVDSVLFKAGAAKS